MVRPKRHLRLSVLALLILLVVGSILTTVWLTEQFLSYSSSTSSFPSSLFPFSGGSLLADFQHGTTFDASSSAAAAASSGSFIEDIICGGCYHALAIPEQNLRCGKLIYDVLAKSDDNNKSLKEAATQIATTHQDGCQRCFPGICSSPPKNKKKEVVAIYWKYDSTEISPPILSSSVVQLSSIPAKERIPSHVMNDLESFFLLGDASTTAVQQQQQQQQSSPARLRLRRYLFEYNPSIVILPKNQNKNLVLEDEAAEDDPAVYLASFRVSTQQSCFRPNETRSMYGGNWQNKPPIENYLGLALLRNDLSIVMDVIVDLKTSGVFQHFVEDFRLFIFNNQIFLSSFDYIAPIRITTTTNSSSTTTTTTTKQQQEEGDSTLPSYVTLTNLFPSDLQVSIRSYPSCPVCPNRPNKRCGKNFNYFHDAGGTRTGTGSTTTKVWMELWPTGPHIVQRVDLDQPCNEARQMIEEATTESEESLSSFVVYSDANYYDPTTTSTTTSSLPIPLPPKPTWYTIEEVLFPNMGPAETLLTRGRGGACCISIHDPRSSSSSNKDNLLMVGIYHTKIPKFGKRSGKKLPLWKGMNRNNATATATANSIGNNNNNDKLATNQYLSRWYAFSSTPPFQIVAQSGLFCLGHPSYREQKEHPLIRTTLWKKMIFGGNGLGLNDSDNGKEGSSSSSLILNCPRIHFISSISEKANDPSKVIVAYGINDCISRFIEIEKEAIIRLLFFPLVAAKNTNNNNNNNV